MKKLLNISTPIVICILLFQQTLQGQTFIEVDPNVHPLLNTKSPAITGTTLKGKPFHLDAYQGKVVVLNIWSLKCAVCYKEIIDLNTIVKNYDAKDLVVISLLVESKQDILKKIRLTPNFYKLDKSYAGNQNINFEIIPDAEALIAKFNVQGYPNNFILDQKGVIRAFSMGYRVSNDSPNSTESANYQAIDEKVKNVIAAGKM